MVFNLNFKKFRFFIDSSPSYYQLNFHGNSIPSWNHMNSTLGRSDVATENWTWPRDWPGWSWTRAICHLRTKAIWFIPRTIATTRRVPPTPPSRSASPASYKRMTTMTKETTIQSLTKFPIEKSCRSHFLFVILWLYWRTKFWTAGYHPLLVPATTHCRFLFSFPPSGWLLK